MISPPPGHDRDDRIASALLTALGAALMLVVAVMAAGGIRERSAYFVPLGFVGASVLARQLSTRLRGAIALLLITLALAPWGIEAGLEVMAARSATQRLTLRRAYAEQHRVDFDARTEREVVEDLRASGRDAWPAIHPANLLRNSGDGRRSVLRTVAGDEVLPLAGISNVETVNANESGRYMVFRADAHGFQNPDRVWEATELDVAAIGDSFTHGVAVPADSNLVSSVRVRWPSTLNLGYSGNGPLLELATLFEYLPQRRPHVVLWVVCEANDIGGDLARELSSPLLRRYLRDARAHARLENRQPELDSLLRSFVGDLRSHIIDPPRRNPVLEFLALTELRRNAYGIARRPRDQWDTFSEIIRTARDAVRGWNGTLYLVYLPVHLAYVESPLVALRRGNPDTRRERVLAVGRALDLPVIDIDPVFRQAGDATHAFTYPYRAHFTAAGYVAASNAIAARLEADRALNHLPVSAVPR